jgi:hypothetical protein
VTGLRIDREGRRSTTMDRAERNAHPDRPRCLVVYESTFGNTEEIASAVADGLSSHFDVDVCNGNDAASDLGAGSTCSSSAHRHMRSA